MRIRAPRSGAERATTVATLQQAIESLPKGVTLGAISAAETEILGKEFPIFVVLYENPDLMDDSHREEASAAAHVTLQEAEELMTSESGKSGVTKLMAYCTPSRNVPTSS